MARSTDDIQKIILDQVAGDDNLNEQLTSTSKVAVYWLWSYIVAIAQRILELLFDQHKSETEEIIASKSPHTRQWYKIKAIAFQYGYSLVGDTDQYAETDTTAQIVKFAAVTEDETTGYLLIKIASGAIGSRAELEPEQLTAFSEYMERVKDAGVRIRKISQEADHLRLVMDVYFDPLVFNDSGERLDGTGNTSVQDTITAYLENLTFNGEYSNMALTDALQLVDGVKIPQLLSAEAYWGAYEWEIISAKYLPEAGWLKIYDDDLTINWIAYDI